MISNRTNKTQDVAELVRRSHRIGITAVSHKVISNLLQYACAAARAYNIQLRGDGNRAERPVKCL